MADKGIGVSELVSGRNVSGHCIFKNKSVGEISQNLNNLDNLPKSMKFSDYEKSMFRNAQFNCLFACFFDMLHH